MSRRAFFVWEKGLRGPAAAVLYDDIRTVNGKPQEFLAQFEIEGGTENTRFFPFEPDSPDFRKLAKVYPCPAQEIVT